MINKKIASEIAIGAILLLAILIGSIFWMQNKTQVSDNVPAISAKSEPGAQQNAAKQEQVDKQAVQQVEIKAYSESKDGKNFVILQKNDEKKVVDQGDVKYDKKYSNLNDVKNFSDIKLSPLKNYLTYNMSGWEWKFGYLYNVKNESQILKQSFPTFFDFTPDEKYFVDCGASIFDGTLDGKIYSVENFNSPIFDAVKYSGVKLESYSSLDCKIDGDNVSFYFNNDDLQTIEKKPKNKTIIYSISQGKVVN